MSTEEWERKVLADPDAAERVENIERELRSVAGLTVIPGETVVPAEFFDALLRDLDRPDEPNPNLARAADRAKRARRSEPPSDKA